MIDFKTEVEKYKPVLSVDEVENAVYSDEVRDVIELLQYITQKVKS